MPVHVTTDPEPSLEDLKTKEELERLTLTQLFGKDVFSKGMIEVLDEVVSKQTRSLEEIKRWAAKTKHFLELVQEEIKKRK